MSLASPHYRTTQRWLFSGGAVFDGETLLAPDHAVLVDGAVIVDVGPAARFTGFDGARFETEGLTLLPGLIDCHAHLTLSGEADVWAPLVRSSAAQLTLRALDNAQACLRGGITALRDCGGVDHVELAVRDACNADHALGPTIRAAGRFICMTGGANAPVARVADGAEEVRKAVREEVRAGSDWVKLMATGSVLTPGTRVEDVHYTFEELEAGVQEASRQRRRCAAHAIGAEGVLNAARAGVASVEHGMVLTDECVAEMLARDIVLVPTLAAIACILENATSVADPAAVEKAVAIAERHRASVKAYHAAGGRIAMGADTGTPFNPHGGNARELAHMVAAGLTLSAALRAATAVAADLLDLPTRGRLAPGMTADLLLVDGNLAEGIDAVADPDRHVAVFKNGRSVARTGLWGLIPAEERPHASV